MIKPSGCKPCSLHNISTSFTKPEGEGYSGVLLIGEAAGHEEAIDGLPFRPRAQAGSLLEKVIKEELGLSRDWFKILNIIQCQPPNNKLVNEWYEATAISCCGQYRDRIIQDFQPPTGKQKVIVALGATAFRTLTGEGYSLTEDDIVGHLFYYKGKKIQNPLYKDNIFDNEEFVFEENVKIPVIPTYHPSFVKRGNHHLTQLLAEHIKRAVNIAKGNWLSPDEYNKKKNYRIVGFDDASAFLQKVKDNPRMVMSYDIETNESKAVAEDKRDDLADTEITQIQFALDKYNAVVFPNFQGHYFSTSKKLLELPNLKAGHYVWNFDNFRLKAKGIKLDETRIHDTLWMFKHWSPKLPRGLQIVAGLAGFPFAWKHLFSTDPEEYGGADVCSIHFILEWLPRLMKEMKQEFDTGFGEKRVVNVWEGYKNHVFGFHPHLQQASDDGIPVSEERRLDLDKELEIRQKEVDKEIQRLIPDEIRNIEPFKKIEGRDNKLGIPWERYDYGFVRTPTKQIEEARIRYENAIAKIQEAGRNGSKNVVSFYQFLRKSYNLCQLEVKAFDRKTGESKGKVVRWCRILPFKASFDQMSNYINWKHEQLSKSEDKKDRALAKFYKVPKDAKGKETTAKGEIELLYDKTGDELLQLNLEARSLVTNRRNYIPNWKPNQFTGAVHTKWSFSPPQGQLVSYRPNVLNLSHHTQVGQLFRRIVEAPEGWEFGEFDKKSFHVGMMGYKANDANYIRFSQLDPHSIYCSYIAPKDWGIKPITMDMSDGEILEVCKWIKNRCKQEEEKIGKPWANMRQAQAKPTVLGNQLELGYKKLYWQNRRSIASEARAKELQGILGEFSQKVVQAKVDIKWLAYRTGRLMNEFGRIQWFNDVIANTWNKSKNVWEKRFGDEAREAIAFAVQSPAFGMIHSEAKRIIPRLVELDLGYRPFRNSIHDSLVFIWQKVHRDRIVPIVLEEMRKPCRELTNQATGPEGLRIEVEYKLGRNLQNYDKIKNPEGMQEVKG